jgi:hypothetical protein
MNKIERTQKALEICFKELDVNGMGHIVKQAQAIINEPQIKVGEHFYGIAVEDDGGGRSFGTPILHETNLHESRTLKSVVARADFVGDGYGRKYLAQITIIEEL